jgi:glycosyltransferase involved in cell wall biosynthesis
MSSRRQSLPQITFDLRLIGQSGIGRYLEAIAPRVVGAGGRAYTLLGSPEALARAGLTAGPGVEIREVAAPMYSLREQWRVARAIPSGTDLFWAPHYNIPLAHRGRLLVTLHDLLHLAMPEFVPGVHRRAYARVVFAAVRRRAAHLICVSEFTASEAMRLLDLPAARMTVVHQGVDEAWFHPPATPLEPERPFLLYIGNVKPHKNLRRLVEAFAALRDEIPHHLLLVGRREGLITADTEVARLAGPLGERVRFTGEVDDAALRRYLGAADALVLPSLYEGFGLPALEAMAAGCPVLASTAASLPEVCGDAALYFDPRSTAELVEAIRRLVRDPALGEELRERGAARARRFTWERCARETGAVLDGVLSGLSS